MTSQNSARSNSGSPRRAPRNSPAAVARPTRTTARSRSASSALERKLTPPHALVPLERFESPVGRVEGFRQSMNGRRPADPYLEFENVFRGPERVVRDRQQRYLRLIGHRQPVLDLGCGRGEFLEVLRQDGLSAHGVDLDRAMVEHCRSKGLDVSEADVVDHLETLPDASVGVVFASQVIEHLPYPRLLRFLGAARAKLRPAGLLIVETPNPHYPLALRNFWIDPTHQHPLFPEVVLALCRLSGFTGGYIWHPGGIGDPDQDRTAQPDYAIVAEVTAPAAVIAGARGGQSSSPTWASSGTQSAVRC